MKNVTEVTDQTFETEVLHRVAFLSAPSFPGNEPAP